MSAPLVGILPGPRLLVWTGGNKVADILLDETLALGLIIDLAAAIAEAKAE